MTAEKGSAFLLKVGDGATTPVYSTVAGLRTTQLSVNGDAVVITNKGSGAWRELLSGAGVRSVSVSGASIRSGLQNMGSVAGGSRGSVGNSARAAFADPSLFSVVASSGRGEKYGWY